MAIEIVDLPIKNCDIPVRKMLVYQRVTSRVEFQNNFRALSRMDMRWYESKSGNHKLNDFWMLESRLFSFPMVQHVWTHKCWLQKNRHVFCLCPHLGPFFPFCLPIFFPNFHPDVQKSRRLREQPDLPWDATTRGRGGRGPSGRKQAELHGFLHETWPKPLSLGMFRLFDFKSCDIFHQTQMV